MIFFSSCGSVLGFQLSDFGLATQVADVSFLSATDGVAGTFGYIMLNSLS